MIKININKNDITRLFIAANHNEIDYDEQKNIFIITCKHQTQCSCRRLEKIDRIIKCIDGYTPKDMKTIATLSLNINISKDYIIEIDQYHQENQSYLINIIDKITHQEFIVYSSIYKYKIFEYKINSLKTLKEAIMIFNLKEVKLPESITDRVGVEIIENYLLPFGIDMKDYNFSMIRYNDDRDVYIAEFTNHTNGCSIKINDIVINELDGTVYSCGNNQNCINF